MAAFGDTLSSFVNNRWFVLLAAMWVGSCAGSGYVFGSISPVIKRSLGYNQKELAALGVAKNIGASFGFLAAALCEVLPLWQPLLIGSVQHLVGYGWVWMVVTGRAPVLPLWAMCTLIFIAQNGHTYTNIATLVCCVENFSENRGPVVGILKGFIGLGGAIIIQFYTTLHLSNDASLIFVLTVGPPMVDIALMFFVKPVGGAQQIRPSDGKSFTFLYSVCLILATYLLGVMLIEDLFDVSQDAIIIFSIVLSVILVTPLAIPLALSCSVSSSASLEETLLSKNQDHDQEPEKYEYYTSHVACDREAMSGADFTLVQALMGMDFWLMFFSFLFGSGSGRTVMDNLGQMSESLGYDNPHVFVSMLSIWSFLGRIGGGYFSELIIRNGGYPRPAAAAIAQVAMVFGHLCFAFKFPGEIYIGSLVIGLGYGAHWAIVPATASEVFGLRKFGSIINVLLLSTPVGSLVFSGVIASSIYDNEAEKQARERNNIALFAEDKTLKCEGSICFFLSSLIMSGFCAVAAVLSLILVHRTKRVYARLYRENQT